MTSKNSPAQSHNKPLKRPTQGRAKMTVQAIFDTYVRIWQRDGWERVTTRAVALEAGVAVGTLYDYFPSKQALHSGLVSPQTGLHSASLSPPPRNTHTRI